MCNYMNKYSYKPMPLYNIGILHIMDFQDVDMSTLLFSYMPCEKTSVPVYSFLITGPDIPPMIVDTGAKESDFEYLKKRYRLNPTKKPYQTIEAQLQRFGYRPEDIGVVLHTHLHLDHCGQDDLFPNAKIIF